MDPLREGPIGVRVGRELGDPVPGSMRVAVPPADVRPPDAASGGSERRRGSGRDGDQFSHPSGQHRDEPLQRRVLPGSADCAAGGGVGVYGGIRERSVPGISRAAAGGEEQRGELQCARSEWEEVPGASDVGPRDFSMRHACVKVVGSV